MPTDEQAKTEEKVLAEARQRIKEVRQGDLVVRVVGPEKKPIVGAVVEVEQTSSDFLFGCNIYAFDRFDDPELDQAYKERFRELFNFATLPFYWAGYEPEQGKPGYAYTDKVADWCRENGIVAKGHPLVWTHRAGLPKWLPSEPDLVTRLVETRVTEVVTRYRGKIDLWDVVNEPIHTPAFGNWTTVEHVAAPLRRARAANPDAQLIVNEYYMFAREKDRAGFRKLLDDLVAAGAPFDAIGLQAHEPAHYRFSSGEVMDTLDAYADLGKPLHITEFVPASDGEPTRGLRHAPNWTEEEQADFATTFYTLCFSHAAVEAITWWDLSEAKTWRKGGSLCREDMTPKPAYLALKKLIHEDWRTKRSGQTDGSGTFRVRGFTGDYICRITVDGEIKESTTTLPRDGAECTVTVERPER